ncbi:MAG: branched-chain amino acid transporter permease [bacterium]|nr:branched-chain amino acid transporter permease [bacterium]
MPDLHSALMVAVVALVTIALRFAPFLIFRGSKQTPAFVAYLGRVLPYAIMGMLVVYCLRNISFASAPHGAPELIACAVVAALHLWKRNTLISIVGGTVCYMLLIQLVF